MKILIVIIATLPLIIWKQCSEDPEDCVCTEEFRTYIVIVVDTLGNPVDSLETTITNEQGKEYNFGDYSPPPFTQGNYFVMTDGYENDFSQGSQKIYFKGTKGIEKVSGEYLFGTDKCLCQVHKISGPDTLILK